MNPEGLAILKSLSTKSADAALEVTKEEAKGFLGKVLGMLDPWLSATGESWAIGPRERLFNNVMEAAVRANRKAIAAGFDPRHVPLKIINPLLEGASLEDMPDMQGVWASLMANAADPAQQRPVYASFPGILKELEFREVKFLDALFVEVQSRTRGSKPSGFSDDELKMVYASAGLSRRPTITWLSHGEWMGHQEELDADVREFGITLDITLRARLLAQSDMNEPFDLRTDLSSYNHSRVEIKTKTWYSFTDLGTAFVSACREPKKKD
jgi:hypothetical protein